MPPKGFLTGATLELGLLLMLEVALTDPLGAPGTTFDVAIAPVTFAFVAAAAASGSLFALPLFHYGVSVLARLK
jgi:hypothetical protein